MKKKQFNYVLARGIQEEGYYCRLVTPVTVGRRSHHYSAWVHRDGEGWRARWVGCKRTTKVCESRDAAMEHLIKLGRRQRAAAKTRCTCREPKSHRDCMYCGCGWAGEVVCGQCAEAGIDGKVIRGTERRVCRLHKHDD